MTNRVIIVITRCWWGVASVVGGLLWVTKSIAILATGFQPDYLFELAPTFLAIASLGLAITWYREVSGQLT